MSADRTLVTFESKPERLINTDGSKKKTQFFKIYMDGISKNSHIDHGNMETFFIPKEEIPASWTKGADLSCNVELEKDPETESETGETGETGNCYTASVSAFDKCDWCNSGLVQLALTSPFSGKFRVELEFNDIGAAGTVHSQSWKQFLLTNFDYQGKYLIY
jgi:hypothetical protein